MGDFLTRMIANQIFEKRFSFYYDYPGNSQLIGSQKETAVDEIFERITQDIFNEALAKW